MITKCKNLISMIEAGDVNIENNDNTTVNKKATITLPLLITILWIKFTGE